MPAPASARHELLASKASNKAKKDVTTRHLKKPNHNLWDDYLIKMRSAALRATQPTPDVAGALEASTPDFEPSEEEKSSSESLRLETPMVRFLVSDDEDASRHPAPPAQEVPSEDVQEGPLAEDSTSSEDVQSLDSWSDPERTIASIHENVGLAERLF